MDRDLVERAQRGDRQAYEALVRAHARRLYLVCQRILRDCDLAEDATQRALVAIWTDLRGLRDLDRFEAWTYRLAVRASLAEVRRSRRFAATVQPLSGLEPARTDGFDSVTERDALDRAFAHLSPEHRAVVVLRYFADMTLDEIATVVEAPAGTVASRLHYALRQLRSILEPDEPSRVVRQEVSA